VGDGSEGASATDVGAPFKTVKTDSRTVTAFGAPSLELLSYLQSGIHVCSEVLRRIPLSNDDKERHSTQTGLKSKRFRQRRELAQFELFYRVPGLVGERAGLGGSGLVFRWPAVVQVS
jgi:hypothetical protein